MSGNPSTLSLLGLAEELSASLAPVGDAVAEQQLQSVLDQAVDAIVDVTQGRAVRSRAHPPAAEAADDLSPAPGAADPAACSALAARCHHAAALLAQVQDQRLAAAVGACLTVIAEGLQRLAQDVRDDRVPELQSRQQLRRTLRRAAALLEAPAP